MIAVRAGKAHRAESLALIVLRSASGFFIVSIGLLIVYLAIEGTKLFTVDHKSLADFLFSASFSPDQGHVGALAFILGSLFVTGFAIAVGGPFGVAVGVFFAELAPKRVASAMKPAIEVLVGIPSVVYGWLGLVLETKTFSAIAGGLALGILMLPIVILATEEALLRVPRYLREGSLALGATRWETIWQVLLPAASSGISVAVILGIARAIGETLAIQLVLGNAPVIPAGLLSPASALTSEIVMDMGGAAQGSLLQHSLFAMAFLLLLIAMGLIVLVKLVARKAA